MSDGKGYDRGRLMRGATRPVVRRGPMQFLVKGNEQRMYAVNLELDTPCDCMDAQYHGRPCLHEIAARLQNGDVGLIQAHHTTIVPMCPTHHRMYDEWVAPFDVEVVRDAVKALAPVYATEWRSYSGEAA